LVSVLIFFSPSFISRLHSKSKPSDDSTINSINHTGKMTQESVYKKLEATAKEFVLSTSPKTPGTNETDAERFLAGLAPSFHIHMGHKYFVSTAPALQSHLDGPAFLEHQGGMAKKLQTWDIKPTNTCVDVEKKTAVVRADFYMSALGHEPVLNDIVFWITMSDDGSKVVDACEFVDPMAVGELRRRMAAPQ
jgi:hypothetical protein